MSHCKTFFPYHCESEKVLKGLVYTCLPNLVYAVALKLHTLIQGHDITLNIKSHNCEMNFD